MLHLNKKCHMHVQYPILNLSVIFYAFTEINGTLLHFTALTEYLENSCLDTSFFTFIVAK